MGWSPSASCKALCDLCCRSYSHSTYHFCITLSALVILSCCSLPSWHHFTPLCLCTYFPSCVECSHLLICPENSYSSFKVLFQRYSQKLKVPLYIFFINYKEEKLPLQCRNLANATLTWWSNLSSSLMGQTDIICPQWMVRSGTILAKNSSPESNPEGTIKHFQMERCSAKLAWTLQKCQCPGKTKAKQKAQKWFQIKRCSRSMTTKCNVWSLIPSWIKGKKTATNNIIWRTGQFWIWIIH